jgi:ribonuclease P protein component
MSFFAGDFVVVAKKKDFFQTAGRRSLFPNKKPGFFGRRYYGGGWYKVKKYGFPRSLRLTKKADFQRTYQEGRSFSDYASVLYVQKNGSGQASRLGVAVGKKMAAAATRNRLKRLMRETYRHLRQEIKPGFDLIWIARRPLLTADIALFAKSFRKLAQKAALFNPPEAGGGREFS